MGMDMELGMFTKKTKIASTHQRVRFLRLGAVLLLPFLLGAGAEQRESEKDTTAILQAGYIYNISKLVQWKDPAMQEGNFIIGVVGSANLYQELIRKYANRMIGRQPIEVRKLGRTTDPERCHILFVSRAEATLIPQVRKKAQEQGILLITEYPDALEDGAIVNFVKVENTLRYELSVANARKQRIEVAQTLKNLAYRTEE